MSDSGGIFGVQCPNCEHVSYYNRQIVCVDDATVIRRVIFRSADGKEHDRLFLRCTQNNCNHEMVIEIDCEAYR